MSRDEDFLKVNSRLLAYIEAYALKSNVDIHDLTSMDDLYLFPDSDINDNFSTFAHVKQLEVTLRSLFEACGNPNFSLYKLHCFRRGGAQHRLFKTKKAWPLSVMLQ